LGDVGVEGRIILKWISNECVVNGFIWLSVGTMVDSCHHGNEP